MSLCKDIVNEDYSSWRMVEWPCRRGEAKSITLWQVIRSSKAERAPCDFCGLRYLLHKPYLSVYSHFSVLFSLRPWKSLKLVFTIKKESTYFFLLQTARTLMRSCSMASCVQNTICFFFLRKKEKLPQVLPFVSHPFSYLIWAVQCKRQDVWTFSSHEYKQELQGPVIMFSHEVFVMYFPLSTP